MYLYNAIEKLKRIHDQEGKPYMVVDREGKHLTMSALMSALVERYATVERTPEFNDRYVILDNSIHRIVNGCIDWLPVYTVEYNVTEEEV